MGAGDTGGRCSIRKDAILQQRTRFMAPGTTNRMQTGLQGRTGAGQPPEVTLMSD